MYLPDKDLKSFSLVQRAARDAVIPANAGHWRQRFKDQYDLPPGKSPASIKEDYILRRCFLTHRIHLKYGQSPDEIACLKAIRQLILGESTAVFAFFVLRLRNLLACDDPHHALYTTSC